MIVVEAVIAALVACALGALLADDTQDRRLRIAREAS